MASNPSSLASDQIPARRLRINPSHIAVALVALVLSAAAFYFGTGLHPIWSLTWFAPLPMLLMAPRLSRWTAWSLAFAAFLLGALNVWSYDRIVTPLWLTIFILIVPSLVFAFVVSAHRGIYPARPDLPRRLLPARPLVRRRIPR